MTHDTSSGASDDRTLIGAEADHDFGDRFKVMRWLGRGGMGDVYLAMDNNLHRRVAIKVIRPDLSEDQEIRQRIERECLLHAKVGPHPNIVTLFDKLERGGEIQLVMEFVEGQTLREYIDAHQEHKTEPPRGEAFRVTMQMLDALARIHAEGIVHRDIKPANVMLVRDDDGELRAKLMDFGIARLESGGSQFTNMMRTARSSMGSPGTPLYMAPEQFDSETFGPVSARTDVYAMGIVLYELIAGRTPFTGSLTEILRGHLNSSPPPIRSRSGAPVPAPLVSVIHTALAKKPGDRFVSAAVFRDTLGHLSEIESSSLSEMATLPELSGDHRQKAKDDDDDLVTPLPTSSRSAARPAAGRAPAAAPAKRKPIFARIAVIVAGLLLLLGFVGILQVFSGSGEPTDPSQPPEERDSGDGSAAPTSDTLEPSAGDPADASVPPVNVAVTVQLPATDGIPAVNDALGIDATAQPPLPDGAASMPPGIVDPPGIPADTLPGSLLGTADPSVTVPPPTQIPEEGFSMGSEAVALPNAAAPAEGTSPVTGESAMAIVDQGLAQGGTGTPGTTYTVKPGDSLSKISTQVNIDMYNLAIWNELERPNDLTVGQTLYLYKRDNLKPVNPQWARPAKKTTEPPPAEVAPAPEPTPPPAPPAPVVEEEKKGFFKRVVDKLNRKQREKNEELQKERGE